MNRSTHKPIIQRDIAFVHDVRRHSLIAANANRNTVAIQIRTKLDWLSQDNETTAPKPTYSGFAMANSVPTAMIILSHRPYRVRRVAEPRAKIHVAASTENTNRKESNQSQAIFQSAAVIVPHFPEIADIPASATSCTSVRSAGSFRRSQVQWHPTV